MEDYPIIHNLLRDSGSLVFVFLPTPEDPLAGWRRFFEFADGYSRLPDDIIKHLGDYYFEARLPSSSGS